MWSECVHGAVPHMIQHFAFGGVVLLCDRICHGAGAQEKSVPVMRAGRGGERNMETDQEWVGWAVSPDTILSIIWEMLFLFTWCVCLFVCLFSSGQKYFQCVSGLSGLVHAREPQDWLWGGQTEKLAWQSNSVYSPKQHRGSGQLAAESEEWPFVWGLTTHGDSMLRNTRTKDL